MVSVIVAGARTPMGRLLGGLKDFDAVELGGLAIRAALERAGLPPEKVQYAVMGHVLSAGAGQITARQAAVKGGLPMTVPALTVDKVCLSGLEAIVHADRLIRTGEYDIVVAGGMESMTRAPHVLHARAGVKYGDAMLIDSMERDGLWDAFTDQPMGALTDEANTKTYAFGREEQDAYAVRSHQRAAEARATGVFEAEIAPVSVPQRKGEPLVLDTDEGVRPDTSLEVLARLRPSFGADGAITAGSSSPISDGAAAVVVVRKETAEELGLSWIAEIGAHATVAGPDSSLQLQPANAITKACAKEGVEVGDLDLIEINEAFAAVALASARELGLPADDKRLNACGGAIALGHPLGMSGARLALHLAMSLEAGQVGVAALCGGGGQGEALVIRGSVPVGG